MNESQNCKEAGYVHVGRGVFASPDHLAACEDAACPCKPDTCALTSNECRVPGCVHAFDPATESVMVAPTGPRLPDDLDGAICRHCGTRSDWHDEADGACPDDDGPHPYSAAYLESAEARADELNVIGHMVDIDRVLALPIEELELGVRAYNIVKRHNVNTLRDILRVTANDLNDWIAGNPNRVVGLPAAMQIAEAQSHIREILRDP